MSNYLYARVKDYIFVVRDKKLLITLNEADPFAEIRNSTPEKFLAIYEDELSEITEQQFNEVKQRAMEMLGIHLPNCVICGRGLDTTCSLACAIKEDELDDIAIAKEEDDEQSELNGSGVEGITETESSPESEGRNEAEDEPDDTEPDADSEGRGIEVEDERS